MNFIKQTPWKLVVLFSCLQQETASATKKEFAPSKPSSSCTKRLFF